MFVGDIETMMSELIFLREIPFDEIFKIFQLGTDISADMIRANRTLSICLLTISFSLFVLFLSFVYISPDVYINYCDFESSEDVPQIQYNEPSSNLIVERYTGAMTISDFIEDSYSNFFPDIHDIEIIDETNDILERPKLLEPEVETNKNADAVDREALTAVKMALKFKKMNNMDKAKKLFQHALALSPNHHDVLLHYGEFLESGEDFINADHFYLKAIMLRPKNSRALANRKRTLPVVNQLDLEELQRIDSKRAELIRLNKKDPTLKRLKKEIYFQHIHHTVAIEGNTMTLAETRTVVETKLAVSGKSIIEHNEILGVEAALRYVNQTLANNNRDIHVSDILEIHKRVMGNVDPLTAGTFRKTQVFVGEHTPPAASDVELLMEEFVRLLRSHTVRSMHPIQIAAFVHHKLVFIHPFLDGNGRTARLLMNLIFLRYGYPPIIIRKEDRSQYYKLLQIANEGDRRPFYRFIARAAEYTIDAFLRAHECKQSGLKALESTHDLQLQKSVHALCESNLLAILDHEN